MSGPSSNARAGTAQSTDDAARERATDPHRSVVLQAPAGSGKTSVLTQRLLRLLAQVSEPEEILAITFTRRAAAQMRERVVQALKGEVGPGELGERVRTLAAAVLERSAERGWRLEQDPGRLRIQTIDAFNLSLASRLPLAARAGGGLNINTRPEQQYRLAARRTLLAADTDAQLAADVDLWFERLDNKWGNVERMLSDMLAVRAHWLGHLLGHEPEALGLRVGESLEHIVSDHLTRLCARVDEAVRTRAARLAGVGPLECGTGALPAWKTLARLVLTKAGGWRRRIDRSVGEDFESAAAKAALRGCIDELSAIAGARELLLEAAALPPARLDEQDSAALAALARVLRHGAAQLQVQFADDGQVDYTCIAGAARAALTEDGQPTDLALRAGLSLRHILVDEFQDTSAAQSELLGALTAGWEAHEGRTLFVVGDPMQSIYMFREAEVGCFLKVRDAGIGPIRLEPLRLTRNFRSVPALIEWVNERFRQLFPAQDALRESAVSFTPSIAGGSAVHAEPAVRLRLFTSADRRAETDAVIERISEINKLEPGASIAVLVAARTHARAIMTSLHEHDIEAIGVDLVPLREVPVVRDLVALARALCDPGDRTAWLAVLRAPWCGSSLASLTPLSRRDDTLLVWEALRDEARLQECPRPERARIERVRAVLDDAIEWRGRLPVADWLERTWLALGAADCYAPQDLRHARAFFDAVSERTAALQWRGPESLDSVLRGLFARARARAAHPVQILTIHHAKGLEFDHVLIPGLDRRLNRGAEPLLRWLDLPREHGGGDLLLSPAAAIGEETPGQIGAYVKRLQELRAANEQVRLLYVAATRARRSLHLYAVLRARTDGSLRPGKGTLLDTLWPALGEQFLACVPPGSEHEPQRTEPAAPAMARRLCSSWRPPEPPAGVQLSRLPVGSRSLEPPQFSWVGETARHIGTVVHAALQTFAEAPVLPTVPSIRERQDFYLAQLRRHGVPAQELPEAAARVITALTRTVEDERGRWILSRDHREASSELALTGLIGGQLANMVIDRCFVDARGTRWVIDFKTSVHQGGRLEAFLDSEMERYRGQLAAYTELARALGPEPVRAGLYFPLLGEFREV